MESDRYRAHAERARALVRERALFPLYRAVTGLALALASRLSGLHYIGLDYPPAAADTPRWGHGKPDHRRLAERLDREPQLRREALERIASFADELGAIEPVSASPLEPSWRNDWIPALDAAAIYAFIRSRAPALYLEIGSGHTTRFAARAKRDGALATRIVSIDPQPRAEIDQLCDEVLREPLESVDLAIFAALGAGDVLVFDGSHRTFPNSDVTTFFLDVLPELRAGVLVGIHDIGLPWDYSPGHAARYYSEQYVLAAYLLGGADVAVVLPTWSASRGEETDRALEALWSAPNLRGVDRRGSLFWFETR